MRLGPAARRVRLLAALAVLLALLAGTFWGNDDHFPFGPFRMYSIANKPDGIITETILWATTERGERVQLGFGSFGLRRAEVEGQLARFEEDPSLLEHLATAYQRVSSEEVALEEIRLVQIEHHLRGGREVRTESVVLAHWRSE